MIAIAGLDPAIHAAARPATAASLLSIAALQRGPKGQVVTTW
jgi:hypothetical protein